MLLLQRLGLVTGELLLLVHVEEAEEQAIDVVEEAEDKAVEEAVEQAIEFVEEAEDKAAEVVEEAVDVVLEVAEEQAADAVEEAQEIAVDGVLGAEDKRQKLYGRLKWT